ncbi:MAG: alkaline phosphatase family protein [Rhodocyclaceae bacterium]
MPASHPRNVLLISADQWRADCLSSAGHPLLRTPNLDRLAAEGTLFRRHFGQAAPCGPARASLLTGLYMMNHRAVLNGTPLDARHTNVALEARRAGYDPILFGYTDTTPDPRGLAAGDPALRDYGGILPGFREGMRYDDEVCLPWLAHLRRRGYSLPEHGLDTYLPTPDARAATAAAGLGHAAAPARYRAEDSDTAYTADRVIEYLQGRGDRPWFVHAVFFRPHPPLYAPEPFNHLYPPEAVPAPQRHPEVASEAAAHPFLAYWLARVARPGAFMGHAGNIRDLPEHEWRQLRATYYGLITEVDHHVGRLIEHLQATGQYEHTLIVFTSDHGEQLGDHWLWGKGGYFDASYHLPLIVRAPGGHARPGTAEDAMTEAVDLMPTVLDWLGLATPATCDGRSLLPLLGAARPAGWRDAVHWEYDFRDPLDHDAEHSLGLDSDACVLNVLRGERYKYVHFAGLPPLLHDLAEDPGELRNLASDPAYREVMLEMTQHLLSLRMRHADRAFTRLLATPNGLHHDSP